MPTLQFWPLGAFLIWDNHVSSPPPLPHPGAPLGVVLGRNVRVQISHFLICLKGFCVCRGRGCLVFAGWLSNEQLYPPTRKVECDKKKVERDVNRNALSFSDLLHDVEIRPLSMPNCMQKNERGKMLHLAALVRDGWAPRCARLDQHMRERADE